MRILFITRLYAPHIGGVETHVRELSKKLKVKNQITILTEKYAEGIKDTETLDGLKIVRFKYPHVKFLGLVFIWREIFKRRKLIQDVDIIHVHDVFIWYLPFRFFYPSKKIFITIHGLEWDNPLAKLSIWQKRLAARFSTGTIGVGKFLEKYTGIKFDLITYGATSIIYIMEVKRKGSIVYVGRLEENTGLLKFLEWLKTNHKYQVDFCGDGVLRKQCKKFGKVHGFTDPIPFLKKAEYCVPGGYLSALEGLAYNCKLKLFWNNKVKEDYWKLSPFVKKNVKVWVKTQTWNKLANEYLNLYNHI